MPPNLLLPASTLSLCYAPPLINQAHRLTCHMCPCPRPPACPARPQQAKLGIPAVAIHTMEMYTTAVLRATLRPPKPPKCDEWRKLMDELSDWSCKAYRAIVVEHPHFISYFQTATPESELGGLNIGEGHTAGMGCVPRLSSALQSLSSAGCQLLQACLSCCSTRHLLLELQSIFCEPCIEQAIGLESYMCLFMPRPACTCASPQARAPHAARPTSPASRRCAPSPGCSPGHRCALASPHLPTCVSTAQGLFRHPSAVLCPLGSKGCTAASVQ